MNSIEYNKLIEQYYQAIEEKDKTKIEDLENKLYKLYNYDNTNKYWFKRKLEILVVEPKKQPYQQTIPHTLGDMKNIVGGLFEFVELEDNVDLVCNEEGKISGLELNRIVGNDIIAGTFFVVGEHEGETISLTEEQIQKYKKIFDLEQDNVIRGYGDVLSWFFKNKK